MYKDENRKIILTETPYLLVNQDLREIINQIRLVVREDLIDIATQIHVPATRLTLGMTTIYKDDLSNNMHFFEVDAINIRELNNALAEIL